MKKTIFKGIATALITGIVTNAILTKVEKGKLGKEKDEK